MGNITNLADLVSADAIAVHNGPFHADDVVSVALLLVLGFSGRIVRTRDAEILKGVIGIDVAGSSCGGQFDHHGEDAAHGVCALTKLWAFARENAPADQKVTLDRLDSILGGTIAAIAAIDSGACRNPSERPNMFGWVNLLNDGSDAKFEEAVKIATTILSAAMERAELWSVTLEEARQALTWDGTPPVLETERAGTKEALHALGCEAAFFVSPHGDDWAVVQTCPKDVPFNPFGGSRVLPKAWGGLRNEALASVCGYKSARFAFNPGGGDVVMAFFGDKADAIACAEAACRDEGTGK